MTHRKVKPLSIMIASGIVAGIATAAVLSVGGYSAAAQAGSKQASQAPAAPTPNDAAHPRGKADAPLPKYDIKLDPRRVALVVNDPQNDFLSPDGVTWGVVGESVTENGTVEHIGQLFAAAHASHVPVFISPHYYYQHDHGWKFEGALEKLMHNIQMFDRRGPLDTTDFEGSGADWLEEYKPHIDHANTIVCSPHKVYGPNTNDLVLQLRKRGIDQVILAGMSANLCTESHMRQLIEQGFEVIVVADATAGAKLPGYDTYEAAFINYRFIANAVWNTETAVQHMQSLHTHNLN